MARSSSGESVIERVVRIFDAFDPETERLSVGDLARRAGLPGSTASRLIDQLVDHGLLHRDSEGLVGMGMRMWELASRASPTRGLREAALPFLEDIHAVVGHHAQLGVLDGTEVLFLERLSAPEAVVNLTFVAGRLPTHASSSGWCCWPTRRLRSRSGCSGGGFADTPTPPPSTPRRCVVSSPRSDGRDRCTVRGTSTRTPPGWRSPCATTGTPWWPPCPSWCRTTPPRCRPCRCSTLPLAASGALCAWGVRTAGDQGRSMWPVQWIDVPRSV